MGLVRSSTASIKAEAIRVNPEEAPERSLLDHALLDKRGQLTDAEAE